MAIKCPKTRGGYRAKLFPSTRFLPGMPASRREGEISSGPHMVRVPFATRSSARSIVGTGGWNGELDSVGRFWRRFYRNCMRRVYNGSLLDRKRIRGRKTVIISRIGKQNSTPKRN